MIDSTFRSSRDAASAPEGAEDAARAPEAEAADAAALAREAAEYKDRLLRTLADMENLRRRTEREIADTRLYGISNFARDILAVADNMERALGALDADLREKADAGTKALLDGVELTERELMKVLEKHGVRKFDPLGEKFDPNLHQAMFELPDPSVPAGTVAQVVQPGYMIGERVLRPALVAVAKGGPKLAAEPPANDNSGSPAQT
ncbi:MAG TPA: nucleotide exchange factor GrpE [Xanthobacteraceae bacterium]|jgi:molecular chaperone GrpE